MIFIETSVFTRRVKELIDEDAYTAFQNVLVVNPAAGDVIEGTGGYPQNTSSSQEPW
jgi:hypothetical protein